jgi:hypothetical protein
MMTFSHKEKRRTAALDADRIIDYDALSISTPYPKSFPFLKLYVCLALC